MVDWERHDDFVDWDRPMLERFKKVVKEAKKNKNTKGDVFHFEGHDYVIAFADYIIQYLEKALEELD